MSVKDAYVSKLRAKLDQWNGKIAVLKAKADEADADLQLEFYKQIESFRTKQIEARDRLDELDAASDDAWDDLKLGIEKAYDDLSDAISTAVQRFR